MKREEEGGQIGGWSIKGGGSNLLYRAAFNIYIYIYIYIYNFSKFIISQF